MSVQKLALADRVAIVTGGGTRLGRGRRLALAVPADVTDSRQVQAMVERTLAEMGRIDILVNTAGIVRGEAQKPIWEVTDEEWRVGIDTNLSGAFYCSRAVAPHMVAQRRGKIINIASG